ncbi:hypothetical protein [Paludibaculum fermentans]|uniref:hypothetical protein n=1 Tax=Paludibaculum fermentans TaxID=1473598 RepID=UPI003EB8B4AC
MLPRDLERQSILIEKLGSLPPGVPLELTTSARRKVQGRLGYATDDTVHINTSNGETVWMFEEVRSVRRLDRHGFGVVHRLLALLLATVCGLSAADLRAKALDIPNGAKVEVQMNSREKISGLLRAVSEQGITVELSAGQPVTQRTIAFEEMKSLKYPRNGLHPGVVVALTLAAIMYIPAIILGN